MARVVVDVTIKPVILDPQGKAILGAIERLGYEGFTEVRQGKHFELEVDDNVTDEQLDEIAESLLTNTVIEDYVVRRVENEAE
ncbi:MAG: phosphoribosylformylglycinamidine synthase subunit PurS [Lawsonella sp.]|nr:phosphoribosylformylglycinamidine synthase subunit PurS [Mycobacteriales bacterium]